MKTIVVSVTNDLVTDQRVHKVCTTLQEMGFEIHLIGRELKNSLALSRNYKTTRMKLLSTKGPLFYAEYNLRLFMLLLFAKKDVLLANDLDTLLPNFLVSKITNKPVVYDSHELFTEVPELIHRPRIQKVWLTIEEFIFPKLKDVFTVCLPIASYYKSRYNILPVVVRNVPNLHSVNGNVPDVIKGYIKGKKSVIYQGAVNLGRGIDLMIDVVSKMENTVLCIFGDGDVFFEIEKKIKREKLFGSIFLCGQISPVKLKEVTPLFDVGMSLEENLGMNYKYALPNKLFDYIHAEIPCLVSDLPEMKRVVEKYKIGELVNDRSVGKIKEQLNKLIIEKKNFKERLILAKKELNWERESEIIKQVYAKYL